MKNRKTRLSIVLASIIGVLIIATQTSFASNASDIVNSLRRNATATLIVNDNPIAVTADKASTKDFNIGTLLLSPGQTMVVAETTGSGVFQDLWYSTNSPQLLMTITVDGEEVWKDETRIFCQGSSFNNRPVGFAGATSCGEAKQDQDQIWSGYVTPPLGFSFQKSLRIEFKNTDSVQKTLYSIRGHYSLD